MKSLKQDFHIDLFATSISLIVHGLYNVHNVNTPSQLYFHKVDFIREISKNYIPRKIPHMVVRKFGIHTTLVILEMKFHSDHFQYIVVFIPNFTTSRARM